MTDLPFDDEVFVGRDHLMALVRPSVKRWFDKLAMTAGDTNVMVSKVEPGRFPAVSLLSWIKRWRDKLAMTTGNTIVMVSKVEPGRFPAVSLLSWIKRWVSEAEPAVY